MDQQPQIYFKEREDGKTCLFDSRSQKFMPGCCVRDKEASKDLMLLANSVARRSSVQILEFATNKIERESGGYTENLLAIGYLEINPDIKERAYNSLEGKKEKKIEEKSNKQTNVVENGTSEAPVKRGRGRPPGSGKKPKVVAKVTSTGKRRGRPPKNK